MGVVSLHFSRGKILALKDCLYVHNVRRNLISVSCLACNGFQQYLIKNLFLLNMMLMRSIVEC